MYSRNIIVIITLITGLFILYKYKKKIGQELIIAFLFALFITSYVEYIYTGVNMTIGTINVFPLVSWTGGLVFIREIYEMINIKYKIIYFSFLYLGLILFVEYVGYHILGIQLDSNYPGLWGLDVLHVPWFQQIFYITAGPIYLLVTDYLNVK
ncbi:hypothetical protein COW81_01750 [Candidatus Campbellbacteria bacterium CG22_combo_CG10-13_8_21_14_all_36_13]|uniref:Lycopene cyclase domain-containing protein n=1 Tax=Candidatus Campbellbacteria bacterium CG22_combo_CG10-13_8_21_14_all_36_13 TaxID=1974529 RepID=A0A2H0DY72_9BACT|nr:MAG: hypothetical protein COW81_01750 [Candidatus Campbellbacteria bacterium CG22_combo_CG10-13_8_21_14_all_36_13]